MPQTHTTRPRPQVEQLEERRLLTGAIAFNSLTGIVTVEGTPLHDRLKLSYAPGNDLRVRLTGGALDVALFPLTQVKGVVFDGNGGRDGVVNHTTVPVQKVEPAPRKPVKAVPPLPPPVAPAPPAPVPQFQDTYTDPVGDGKSMESWSAPGRAARVSIFFDPRSLSADEVARLQDAVAALNGLHTGITLVPTSNPNAQIVVEGKPASPDGQILSEATPTIGPRIGTFANGKKDYQLTHFEIDVFQNMPWWLGADPAPAGSGLYDFRSTMEHELGHAVGLGHDPASYPVNDGYDVMNPDLPSGVARWTYSANDVRELTYLY